MKNIKIFGLAFILLITIAATMAGCSANPAAGTPMALADIEKFNAKIDNDLAKITPILIKLEPLATDAVDIGLAVSGSGALIPVNNAGVSAIIALQTAISNRTGITPDQAKIITNAAVLGLKASGNSTWIPCSQDSASALAATINNK